MIENLFISNVWFALAAGALVYSVNYYLSIYGAYLYHAGAKDTIVFEGLYVLTPTLQKAIAARGFVTTQFLWRLLILSLAILAAWSLCVVQFQRPELFSFLMGGLLLYEAADFLQDFRTIVLFRYARRAEGLQGKIEYSKRLVLTLSVFELYGFAGLYFLMFLVAGSWFFLGGTLTCIVTSRRLRDWVKVRT